MHNALDFGSWQGVLSTLVGLVLVSLVAVSVRLLLMHSVQQRRERQNRQINERLKSLIAAYKVLGGSFTGDLAVDPSHRRELRMRADAADAAPATDDQSSARAEANGSERRRRTRDAVEAALSDIVLLGTEAQVRLAVQAANDMIAGRRIETAGLVISLRTFIREVLDLEAIPDGWEVPRQGPLRGSGGAGARGARGEEPGPGGSGAGRAGGGGTGEAGDLHRESRVDAAGGAQPTADT